MKTLTSIILKATVLSTLIAFLLVSCSEEETANKPRIATANPSDITFNSVTIGGTITSNGGSKILAKGICYGTLTAPTIEGDTTNQGEGDVNFVATINELTPNTIYYARAYAINSAGISYGEEISFTTLTGLAEVTLSISEISYKKANASLTITSNGASAITNSGFVYSTENNTPTIMDTMWPSGSSELTIQRYLTELTVGTKYYIRAFAQNSQGIAYSSVEEITTLSLPQVTDIDGNTYSSVLIGEKIWMAQNLKATKFSNGDPIPTTDSPTQNISAEINPEFQWAPEGDNANIEQFGRMYTWYVANDNRNVCPTDWHVATSEEWVDLRNTIGNAEPGVKLKTEGTTHWLNGGTNSTGFNAVGAGMRWEVGTFNFFKTYGEMWSSTAQNDTEGKTFFVYSSYAGTDHYYRAKKNGLPIRCVKD